MGEGGGLLQVGCFGGSLGALIPKFDLKSSGGRLLVLDITTRWCCVLSNENLPDRADSFLTSYQFIKAVSQSLSSP